MQIVGYHGTNNNFDKFTLDNFGTNDFGYLGKGIYLTNDMDMAQSYADGEEGRLLKIKAVINNPYIITDWKYSYHPEKLRQELDCRNAKQINNKLLEQGYDSVMLKYTDDYGEEFMELCVFNPDNVEIIEETAINEMLHNLQNIMEQALEEDFKSWFKGSKVVDDNGDPLIVYHGTSAEFDTFDNSVNQDKTRQMGADLGYFFTDNETVARRFIPKRQTNKPQLNLDGTNFKNEQEFEEFKIDFENAMKSNDWKPIKDKYSNFFDLRDDYMEVQSKLNVKEDPQAYGLKQCYLQMRNPRYIDGDIIGTGVDREYFLQSSKENGYDGVIIKDADTGAGFANEYIVFKPNQIKSIDAKSFSNSDNIYEDFSKTTTGMSDYDASLNYNDYARETKGRFSEIFLMTPEDYINLCDYGFSQTNQQHTRQKMLDSRYHDKQDIEDLKNKLQNDTIDMLTLEFGMENGNIKYFTQEGLHRAIAAKELGMKEIPVLVMFSGEKGLKGLKRFANNFKQISNNWTDYKFKNKWKNASDLYEFKSLNEKLEGVINEF